MRGSGDEIECWSWAFGYLAFQPTLVGARVRCGLHGRLPVCMCAGVCCHPPQLHHHLHASRPRSAISPPPAPPDLSSPPLLAPPPRPSRLWACSCLCGSCQCPPCRGAGGWRCCSHTAGPPAAGQTWGSAAACRPTSTGCVGAWARVWVGVCTGRSPPTLLCAVPRTSTCRTFVRVCILSQSASPVWGGRGGALSSHPAPGTRIPPLPWSHAATHPSTFSSSCVLSDVSVSLVSYWE